MLGRRTQSAVLNTLSLRCRLMTDRSTRTNDLTAAPAPAPRGDGLGELVAQAFALLASVDPRALAGGLDCGTERITHLKANPGDVTVDEWLGLERILFDMHRTSRTGNEKAKAVAVALNRARVIRHYGLPAQ